VKRAFLLSVLLTLNAARTLGLDYEIGTLEAGKVGDIAIVDGDPLRTHRGNVCSRSSIARRCAAGATTWRA